MNLLLLLQGRTSADQCGYHYAFNLLREEGALDHYHALPYLPPADQPSSAHWPALWSKALDHIREHAIDAVMLQFFHGRLDDPRPFISAARQIRPNLLVATTCGDPYGRWLQRAPVSLIQAARVSDLVFSTSMGYFADELVRRGARNVVLMPHGVCPVRFAGPPTRQASDDFDIVFIGSNNGGRNPFTPLSRAGRWRRRMVEALARRYGKRFGLFGLRWDGIDSWQGPVPFNQQIETALRGRLQVGGFPGCNATYYLSDRPYIAMASNVPFLDCRVEGVESLAEPGRHWWLYDDLSSLLTIVDAQLQRSDAERAAQGAESRDYMLRAHTQTHRAREMTEIMLAMRTARAKRNMMPAPPLRCFRPGIDPVAEFPRALRNWCG